jgi:hypothetical protein
MRARQAQKIILKSYMVLETPKHKQSSLEKAMYRVSRKAGKNTKAAKHVEFWDDLIVRIPRLAAELNLTIAS